MPFAEVDGVRLHYADVGPRAQGAVARTTSVPLLLLHAFPLHSGMWLPQLEAFGADRRVVAPDLPGFGGSDAPDSLYRYTMAGFADLLAGLLDRLGVERVVLGGLSMGGYVSFAFLRQYPERVAALVLADTRATADTHEVFERRTDQQDQVARIGTAALIEILLGGLLCDDTRASRLDLVERVRRLMANPPAGYIGALEAMKHRADATAELPAISVPTLVVVGEHDALAPVEVARNMHERIAGSRLAVLAAAGHLSNMEAADEFNAALADFLATL
ncbi:MAG TPA: alpha/beta fold hydrolase [Acidimicrobiales bacterium]|nr:alpha/beta fold hydrolase [Acidimicrobiales bacterium]